jgi:hypothetical protein
MDTTNIPQPKKERFLQAIALTGNITQAAKLAGCSRHTHKTWLKEEADYQVRFKEAMDEAADLLEHEARRRGVEGVRRLKFQGGLVLVDPDTNEPYVELDYSDTLLIFLLKGARPEKYRERYELSGSIDATQQPKILEDEDWYGTADRLAAATAGPSDGDADKPGPVQGGPLGPKGREDGNGADGNGQRPRK